MDFMTALDIGASGLSSYRTYMNVISMNLANAKTTETMEGGPYVRKSVAMEAEQVYSPFDKAMWDQKNRDLTGVAVKQIVSDDRPFKEVYEPGHPDANEEGYVLYPDINVVEEMTNMIVAQRSYEASAQSIPSVKTMFDQALAIGK
jgi:flagellar basal-body rod protein FlgC